MNLAAMNLRVNISSHSRCWEMLAVERDRIAEVSPRLGAQVVLMMRNQEQ
jgi:hypothetical protein